MSFWLKNWSGDCRLRADEIFQLLMKDVVRIGL
jgi:hypothetical protein